MKNWTSSLLVLAVICAASASTKGAGNLSQWRRQGDLHRFHAGKLRRVHNNRNYGPKPHAQRHDGSEQGCLRS